MRHLFMLSRANLSQFGFFPDAVVAASFPVKLDTDLSLLVWGVVIHEPMSYPDFATLLPEPIRRQKPFALYHSGWSKLTFHGVSSGRLQVIPYEETLFKDELMFRLDAAGEPVRIQHVWEGDGTPASIEYALSAILEHPLGQISLVIKASGKVLLSVDPQVCLLIDEVQSFPARHAFDWRRKRQLTELALIDQRHFASIE